MPVSWKKNYNPFQVIEKLETTRSIGDDGKVGFQGWDTREFMILLYSMLDFSDDIPEIDAREIVSQAIFASGSKGKITAQSLMAEISKIEQKYQNLPIERYALASSISVNAPLKIPTIKFGNTFIIIEHSLPKKFHQEAEALKKYAAPTLFASLPKNYAGVRVHVSAKSNFHAVNQALDTLDFMRGVWNWVINRNRHFRRTFGGKPEPVNEVILGPLHTLHRPNGDLVAKDNWWYEPSYLGAIKPFSPKQEELDVLQTSLARVKKVLKTHNYPEDINNAFVRYARALDQRDWTIAFLKLWSVLELLTDTTRDKYEVTIRRTAYLFSERDYHYQVLQHLREYRNASVHFNKENHEMETYMYQLKNYVEILIHFHLYNKYGFESIQEAGQFLNLSYKDDILKNQIERLSFARKFRGYA